MKQAFIYSLKVWLTTIIIGPIIMGVKLYVFYHGLDEDAWKCLYLTPRDRHPIWNTLFFSFMVYLQHLVLVHFKKEFNK